MNYAIVENGVVVNIIVELPAGINGIQLGDRPVIIGDSCNDGIFTRDGEKVLTPAEIIGELESALSEIEEALNG